MTKMMTMIIMMIMTMMITQTERILHRKRRYGLIITMKKIASGVVTSVVASTIVKISISVDDDDKNRIRAIDIIRVPEYSRVWQVAAMGERSASRCEDFERHEWQTIRKLLVGIGTVGDGVGVVA
jgi:hypothetical protein